jgi:hypothetical protein
MIEILETARKVGGPYLGEFHILDQALPWTDKNGNYHRKQNVVIRLGQSLLFSPVHISHTNHFTEREEQQDSNGSHLVHVHKLVPETDETFSNDVLVFCLGVRIIIQDVANVLETLREEGS